MTTYNTGNPVPSGNAYDRFDNSQTFDELINGPAFQYTNRLSQNLTSWAGYNKQFNDFLINSGFEPTQLVYVDGTPLQVDRPTQLISRGGSVYRVKMPATFPLTLTGTWATDSASLVDVADIALRQALALSSGASLVGVMGYVDLQANLDALARGQAITPEKHGAVGDGVADDTAAVQAAVNDAQDNGGFLVLQSWYRTTATISQTKRLTVSGRGMHNCGLIYEGSAEAWLATLPYVGAGNTNNGWEWLGFGLKPAVAGTGTYGLRIALQLAGTPGVSFFADGRVAGVFIGDFGLQGLYLDNSVGNIDGFFTSRFEYLSVTNSILADKVGDSITFAHSKIFGKYCGLQITGVPGARQMVCDDLNITTYGGLCAFLNVEEVRVIDCQLEHPGYLSGYTGVFEAGVLFFNCFKPELISSTVNPDNGAASAPVNPGIAPATIALTGNTLDALLDRNDIQKGGASHISIAQPSVLRTRIGDNTYYGAAPVILDAGIGTLFPTSRGQGLFAATLNPGIPQFQAISVPGAQLGGFAQAEYTQGSQGVSFRAWVSGPNVVQVRILNESAAPITFGGGNITVKVSY